MDSARNRCAFFNSLRQLAHGDRSYRRGGSVFSCDATIDWFATARCGAEPGKGCDARQVPGSKATGLERLACPLADPVCASVPGLRERFRSRSVETTLAP
jgi:hypothetical protein